MIQNMKISDGGLMMDSHEWTFWIAVGILIILIIGSIVQAIYNSRQTED